MLDMMKRRELGCAEEVDISGKPAAFLRGVLHFTSTVECLLIPRPDDPRIALLLAVSAWTIKPTRDTAIGESDCHSASASASLSGSEDAHMAPPTPDLPINFINILYCA
jgi:hypothetical protein